MIDRISTRIMHHKHLQLLGLLLEATQSGRAVWRRESPAAHHTKVSGIACSLRFHHPPATGGASSDLDVVEVIFGNTVLAFCAGSEGYDLVESILAAAYPEVLEQTRQMARRLDAMIDLMQATAA